jgi:hypothetical protein
MSSSRISWTDEQEAAIKKANDNFKDWLDKIGLKKGMSQKKPLPGVSESVTAHRLALAASLMEIKTENGQPLFPQNDHYTKVRPDWTYFPPNSSSS